MLILVCSSVLVSFGILYYTQITHLEGDLLYFENRYVEIKFPRNWYGASMEYNVSSSGKIFSAIFFDPPKVIYVGLSIFDEQSTRTFFNSCRLTDIHSVMNYQINMTYHEFLRDSNNATLAFIENGTRIVSNLEAEYSIFKILNAYIENGISKNVSYAMLIYLHNQRLVQIAYWGSEETFDSSINEIETFISNLKVRT